MNTSNLMQPHKRRLTPLTSSGFPVEIGVPYNLRVPTDKLAIARKALKFAIEQLENYPPGPALLKRLKDDLAKL